MDPELVNTFNKSLFVFRCLLMLLHIFAIIRFNVDKKNRVFDVFIISFLESHFYYFMMNCLEDLILMMNIVYLNVVLYL